MASVPPPVDADTAYSPSGPGAARCWSVLSSMEGEHVRSLGELTVVGPQWDDVAYSEGIYSALSRWA